MSGWLGVLLHGLLALALPMLAFSGAFFAGLILHWRKRRARAARRSPITSDLLRSPGDRIKEKLEEQYENVQVWLITLVFFPLLIYALHLSQSYLLHIPETLARYAVGAAAALGVIVLAVTRLWKAGIKLDHLKIGLDAEMAVGQELNQLMREGAAIFHDFPAEQFNIDHVVICPAGIYAVETKGRAKPPKGGGSESVRVEFDGQALKFPGWVETKPIEQAQWQADWLERWLTSAVGTPIAVIPVLALPGWFIDRKARSNVRVFNGKKPQFLLKPSGPALLSSQVCQRIVHQVEQRCRNVKPAYRPVEK